MSDTVRRVVEATRARVGIVVVQTTDEDPLTKAIVSALTQLGHEILEWDPVLGSRQGILDKTTQTFVHPDAWEAPTTTDDVQPGDVATGLLATWHARLDRDELSMPRIRICEGCGRLAGTHERDARLHATGCPDVDRPWKKQGPVDRTLVLRGISHLVDHGRNTHDPDFVRALWHVAQVSMTKRSNLILVLPPDGQVPPDLSRHGVVIDDPLPGRDHVADLWRDTFVGNLPPHHVAIFGARDPLAVENVSSAVDRLVGLSRPQIFVTLATATVHTSSKPNPDPWAQFLGLLADAKATGIKASGALEIMSPIAPEELGGMPLLREWLRHRTRAFAPDRPPGLPQPRGLLLAGVSGVGKTLCAKVTAAVLGFPLIRFDFAAAFSKWVGESEANLRRALRVADAAAPIVLLIDEIEKAIGNGGERDGGTSVRALGTLLTWMQERNQDGEHPVFVVASANRVDRLPPELLRKGRFDEIFFVDLPTRAERREILDIHIRRCGVALRPDEAAEVVRITKGFTGAEIAQVVIEARTCAWSDDVPCTFAHLASAVQATRPLSQVRRADVEALQAWAADHCRPAAPPETSETATTTPTPSRPTFNIA